MCPCVGGGYTRGSGFTRGQEGISEGGYVQEAGCQGVAILEDGRGLVGIPEGGRYTRGG